MRDQHRPKQDLVSEVVALRKQVADLREAMAARGRVEEALRQTGERLRALLDGSPVGLCLFRSDGALLDASRPFARILGYDSAYELLGLSDAIGLFASRDEHARVVALLRQGRQCAGEVLFRRKNGGLHACWVMGSACSEPDAIALVVLEALSTASSGGKRSA
jgi:PAS domain S-box-containing protein